MDRSLSVLHMNYDGSNTTKMKCCIGEVVLCIDKRMNDESLQQAVVAGKSCTSLSFQLLSVMPPLRSLFTHFFKALHWLEAKDVHEL